MVALLSSGILVHRHSVPYTVHTAKGRSLILSGVRNRRGGSRAARFSSNARSLRDRQVFFCGGSSERNCGLNVLSLQAGKIDEDFPDGVTISQACKDGPQGHAGSLEHRLAPADPLVPDDAVPIGPQIVGCSYYGCPSFRLFYHPGAAVYAGPCPIEASSAGDGPTGLKPAASRPDNGRAQR